MDRVIRLMNKINLDFPNAKYTGLVIEEKANGIAAIENIFTRGID